MYIHSAEQLERFAQSQKADIVSIDMFDTLVYRRCHAPASVFKLQYALIKPRIPGIALETWVALRRRVEQELARKAHPAEIHLDEIYARIAQELGLKQEAADALKAAEMEVEASVIEPYCEFVDSLRRLHADGKIIMVTTDIYLPHDFIKRILDGFLDFPYLLFCSSETRAPKRSGLAFRELRKRYPAQNIVHVGDNKHADMRRASGVVTPGLVVHPRPSWLKRNGIFIRHLASLGIDRFSIPARLQYRSDIEFNRAELAWRWAGILTDFLVQADRYAEALQVDEVWFSSRDCEVMFEALTKTRRLFQGRVVKYIYTSRAAAYPILAALDPEKYLAWSGKAATEADRQKGRDLIQAYAAQKGPQAKSVLLIDSGWKGRIQLALQSALADTKLYGFYLSTDPECEPQSREASGRFLAWNPAILNQAGAEALAGFQHASCSGYERENDAWKPVFRPLDSDVCPHDYNESLKQYLEEFLTHRNKDAQGDARLREAAVRAVLAFPDQVVAGAFEGWGIGSEVGGDSCGNLIDGGKAGILARLLGRQKGGNIWPQLAMWSVSRTPAIVRGLQLFTYMKYRLRSSMRALTL